MILGYVLVPEYQLPHPLTSFVSGVTTLFRQLELTTVETQLPHVLIGSCLGRSLSGLWGAHPFIQLHGLMASRYRVDMTFTLIPRGMGLAF
jgi:hypothetical protein